MKKILLSFGTRPEAIKLAPVIKALQDSGDLEPVVAVTAQHRQMLDQALEAFDIVPDFDLDVMVQGQSLGYLTSKVLETFAPVVEQVQPDAVVVQGDTTSSFVCALGAFYKQIPVGHVEAGLRTDTLYNPFPEEANRRLTTRLASLHFAPTAWAKANLLAEKVEASSIFVTGNTVVDALRTIAAQDLEHSEPQVKQAIAESEGKRMLLVTLHRRENLGEPMREICEAVKTLLLRFPDVQLVFPMHLNPKVREVVTSVLAGLSNATLIEPPAYLDFVQLLKQAHLVLTDSGGVQEEGPGFGKPVLVARETTERPEGVEAGVARLVGHSGQVILAAASELLSDEVAYQQMARTASPYGDGQASQRIVEILRWYFDQDLPRPIDFEPGTEA